MIKKTQENIYYFGCEISINIKILYLRTSRYMYILYNYIRLWPCGSQVF